MKPEIGSQYDSAHVWMMCGPCQQLSKKDILHAFLFGPGHVLYIYAAVAANAGLHNLYISRPVYETSSSCMNALICHVLSLSSHDTCHESYVSMSSFGAYTNRNITKTKPHRGSLFPHGRLLSTTTSEAMIPKIRVVMANTNTTDVSC